MRGVDLEIKWDTFLGLGGFMHVVLNIFFIICSENKYRLNILI